MVNFSLTSGLYPLFFVLGNRDDQSASNLMNLMEHNHFVLEGQEVESLS